MPGPYDCTTPGRDQTLPYWARCHTPYLTESMWEGDSRGLIKEITWSVTWPTFVKICILLLLVLLTKKIGPIRNYPSVLNSISLFYNFFK